jgi:hypothetical protein
MIPLITTAILGPRPPYFAKPFSAIQDYYSEIFLSQLSEGKSHISDRLPYGQNITAVGCPALWAPRDRLLSEVDALYPPGFAGRYGQLRTRGPGAGLCVREVPDGAAGVPAAGVGAEAARVGATRSVMSNRTDGAKLDPKMRASM